MTYAELVNALHTFGYTVRDQPTLSQVRRRHRELVKNNHPDRNPAAAESMQRINAAASVINGYLDSYRFSFAEEDFYRQHPEERLRMQFSDDPVWGGGR